MSMTDAETEDELEQTPPEDNEGETSSETDEASSQPQPSARERELERRLSKQGQELANTRRQLTQSVSELQASIGSLTENLSARDKREAEQRERDMEAYLNTLPENQRNAKRLEMLQSEVKALRETSRTGAQTARTATPPAAEDPDVAYMRDQAQNIIRRAQERYGVTLTKQEIAALPEGAWNDEHDFHDAVYELAQSKSGRNTESEDTVAERNRSTETPPARRGGSPAAPRPAPPKGKAPTEEDVHSTVQSYNSAEGPRGNIKRLKEMRSKMSA